MTGLGFRKVPQWSQPAVAVRIIFGHKLKYAIQHDEIHKTKFVNTDFNAAP